MYVMRSATQSTFCSAQRGMLQKVAALCGPMRVKRLGNPAIGEAEVGLRAVRPYVLERPTADAADVDAVEGAGDRVESGGVDDHVEFVLGVAGLDAGRGDALDRCLVEVDERHVVLVVDLVVAALERDASGAEAVVLGDQLLGERPGR